MFIKCVIGNGFIFNTIKKVHLSIEILFRNLIELISISILFLEISHLCCGWFSYQVQFVYHRNERPTELEKRQITQQNKHSSCAFVELSAQNPKPNPQTSH